jgi:GNAT superfamily N-acetyltransferase
MIELATAPDLEGVCDLLRVMHQENGVGRVNEAKALGVISSRIEEGGCLVSRQNGVIVGSIAVYRSNWWYSDEVAFFDQWFFVHPKHRTEGHASRLIAAMKQAARNTGVPFVLQVGTTIDALSKLRFFKKHMTPFGGAFIYIPQREAKAA